MSGICALVSFDGTALEADSLSGMIAAAAHRAVDGVRRWTVADAALARLASHMTPEDEFDQQPLVRGGLALVADARIDNRDELLPQLARRGLLAGDPKLTPDAEIILAAHRCWGDEAAAHLIGDFAYVLWDARRGRLLAARDPMGMRPLYYRVEPGRRTLLGSEIKQLLAVPGVPCDIDERGILATIAGPYLPADATVYAGIKALAPGHTLVVGATGARLRRHWDPKSSARLDIDPATCVEAFRERLARAVADRLRASRPVGLFLSGGMDSGSIASMAGWLRSKRRAGGPKLRAYSWAFKALSDSDERDVSDEIVQHWDLDGVAVPADDAWPLAGYPQHGPDRDDPYLWVYQALIERTVARCAQDGVRLLLSGDRGDELLGDWVYDELGLLRAGKVGAAVRDLRAVAAQQQRSLASAVRGSIVRPLLEHRAPRIAAAWSRRRGDGSPPWAPWVPDGLARRVDLGDLVADATRLPRFDGYARSLRCQRLFHPQGARVAVLRNRTRARFGIGFADPFADRRLIELVLALPQWQVQRRGRPKKLARDAMRGVMPEGARTRAAKVIPNSLFDRGFREREVGTVRALLTDSRAAQHGWLDERAALSAYEGFVQTGDSVYDFWWPLAVEMWLRRWWE